MRLLVSRGIVAMLGAVLLAGAAVAQPSGNSQADVVEQILTRSVLERGAFLACARLDQSRETADTLVRDWQRDLADATSLLRSFGYPDADIRALTERYDIEKAAPKFSDLAALGAYCGVLGDWRARWVRLLIMLPQDELRRVLKP
jgi:hypothetical protein